MVRRKIKWKFAFCFYVIVLNVLTKSLPIDTTVRSIVTIDDSYKNFVNQDSTIQNVLENIITAEEPCEEKIINTTRNAVLRQNLRPGQTVRRYSVELDLNGASFTGRAVIDVALDQSTRDDPILLYAEDLTIDLVLAGVFTDANTVPVEFDQYDGMLEIRPSQPATSYIIIVNYSGSITNFGAGIFQGEFNGQ